MKKKTKIAVAIALAVALGALVHALTRLDEGPLYHGKSVVYLVEHAGNSFSNAVVIPRMDSNAVPYLVRELERRDGNLKQIYARVWGSSPAWIQKWMAKPLAPELRKRNALLFLGMIGPPAKPAIPAMLRIINENENIQVSLTAIDSLARLGVNDMEVQAALRQAAASTNFTVRSRVNGLGFSAQ